MNLQQYNCPHCDNTLQIERSSGDRRVSCPHCSGVVQLPELAADGREAIAPLEPPLADATKVGRPAPSEDPAAALTGAAFTFEDRDTPAARTLTRDGRRRIKNLILWGVCALILGLVLWFLMARGPLTR